MSYFSAADRDKLNADPTYVYALYMRDWRKFAADLGAVNINMNLGASILPVAFAAIAAFDMKDYGPEPADVSLPAILASPTLACDGYVRLAWYLTQYLPQIKWAPARIAALGWDKGAVGNHAQMMVYDGTNTLLLDPTIGIVARIGYDGLVQGKPPAAVMSFWSYNSARAIGSFEKTVMTALQQGKYRPADALYYVPSLAQYNTLPATRYWQTPAVSGPLIR